MNVRHVFLLLVSLVLVACAGGNLPNQTNGAGPNASPAANFAAPGVDNAEFAQAQASQPPQGIYIISDASGSMLERLPDKSRKIDVAKKVLKDFVAGDFAGYEVALRVYGHRKRDDCADSELVVPFGAAGDVVSPIRLTS